MSGQEKCRLPEGIPYFFELFSHSFSREKVTESFDFSIKKSFRCVVAFPLFKGHAIVITNYHFYNTSLNFGFHPSLIDGILNVLTYKLPP